MKIRGRYFWQRYLCPDISVGKYIEITLMVSSCLRGHTILSSKQLKSPMTQLGINGTNGDWMSNSHKLDYFGHYNFPDFWSPYLLLILSSLISFLLQDSHRSRNSETDLYGPIWVMYLGDGTGYILYPSPFETTWSVPIPYDAVIFVSALMKSC